MLEGMEIYHWDDQDSPMWSLLCYTIEVLRGIDFDSSREPMKKISPKDIIMISTPRDKDYLKNNTHLPTPGIWVFPIEENISISDGDVKNEMIVARIVAMIMDRSHVPNRMQGLRTWSKWQWQISRAMRQKDFQGKLRSDSQGYEFCHLRVRTIETLEDVSMDVRNLFRSGVMIDGVYQGQSDGD